MLVALFDKKYGSKKYLWFLENKIQTTLIFNIKSAYLERFYK